MSNRFEGKEWKLLEDDDDTTWETEKGSLWSDSTDDDSWNENDDDWSDLDDFAEME